MRLPTAPTQPRFPESGNGPYRLFRGVNQKLVERWNTSLDSPVEAQQDRLREILGRAVGSAFGHEHGLVGHEDLEAFRQKVPVRSYDGHAPWMERVHRGESGVLVNVPVTGLLKTSGTTGAAKLLPLTDAYEREVQEGQTLWRLALMRDHERVTKGSALTVVSPATEGRLPSGLPFGNNTGRMQASQPWYVKLRYAVPDWVFGIEDSEARVYALLRFALQADVTSITTANPSTLLLLARKLLEFQAPLTRDLAEGTMRHGPLAGWRLPRRVRWRLKKARVPTDWRPARIWDLETVNCWKGGPARFFLDRLPEAFGGEVTVREVGITASEGYFAVPMGDGEDGGVAWLGGHVLEFLDSSGRAHWAWELEEGREYRLVVTTSGGLYRYDLNDVLEVTGHVGQVPILRFVRKGGNVLNVTGEKLTEDQVLRAGRVLGPVVGFTAHYRMDEVPALVVAYEGAAQGTAEAMDRALCEANIEFASKRSSGRLAPVELLELPAGSYAAYRGARVAQGASDGQVKDLVVAVTEAQWRTLLRR